MIALQAFTLTSRTAIAGMHEDLGKVLDSHYHEGLKDGGIFYSSLLITN